MLLSYLEGEDAEKVIPTLTDKEAYKLGIEAGKVLQKLHSIPIPKVNFTWKDRYMEKVPKKIKALKECKYKLPLKDFLVNYFVDKVYLMDNRPLLFSHGDYHAGNMIVNNGKIGIIDFDKNTVADPYDELKPFCWNVFVSEYFETGLINGYFNNHVPEDFFKILKYYSVESLISQLPWSVQFGDEDIKVAYRVYDAMLKWWGNFNLDIPTWYKGIIDSEIEKQIKKENGYINYYVDDTVFVNIEGVCYGQYLKVRNSVPSNVIAVWDFRNNRVLVFNEDLTEYYEIEGSQYKEPESIE